MAAKSSVFKACISLSPTSMVGDNVFTYVYQFVCLFVIARFSGGG